MSQPLELLARRVMSDPFFLASPLACFAQSEGLDEPALAARLGCDVAVLTALRLCRSPDPRPPGFWKDVQAIAGRLGLQADALAEAVRLGQNLQQMRCAAGVPGSLLAARDREPGDGPDGSGPGGQEPGGNA
jgi:hypothetical protein